jgi:hypothetical protein
MINKYFSKRRIQLEEEDFLILLSHAHTYFTNLSESLQNQIQNISNGLIKLILINFHCFCFFFFDRFR